MSSPQGQPQWYPPPPPAKGGLSAGAIVAIVLGVVVVVIVVGGFLTSAYLANLQQTSNLSQPNVTVTNTGGHYTEDCGVFGSQKTNWDFSATLVNTGGGGYARIGFEVNGQQLSSNNYYVAANSELPISTSFTVSACYGSNIPTYRIVLLGESP